MGRTTGLPLGTPTLNDLVDYVDITGPTSKKATMASILALGSGGVGLTGVVDAQRDHGAVGNGVTDDTAALQAALDAAFGPVSAPHGTADYYSNKVLYIPPGYYKLTDSLRVKHLQGGRIIGGGRFVTTLAQWTENIAVFETNGCGYSHFEGIRFWSNSGGICFDLDWDGSAGGAALQSNTFLDCFFHDGAYGVKIGNSGFMGSEALFLNCFWITQTVAGLACLNANALQQTVIGGNFQTCQIGIWTAAGSCNLISGVGFQQSVAADIQTEALVNNTMSVVGCRSESKHFIINNGGQSMHVSACSHTSAGGEGYFYSGTGGQSVLSGNISTLGRVLAKYWARICIQSSRFGVGEDWLQFFQPWLDSAHEGTGMQVEIENSGYVHIAKQRVVTNVDNVSTKTYNYDVTEI